MATKQRVELHLHTNMSELDGVSDIREYMELAAKSGMTAIAVTDHAVAHSFPVAYKKAKEVGIKLIYGVEGYLVEDVSDSTLYHVSILVKNKTGLKNLYKLITKSHIDYLHNKPLIPRRELIKHREGLIYGSACACGQLFNAILDEKNASELEDIANFYDYLEIQPISNHRFLIESGLIKDRNVLVDINKKIIEIGEKLNKPVVATGDVHYAYPVQKICRDIIAKYYDIEENDLLSDLHLKSTNEMLEEFSYLGKEKAYEIVVENSNRITDLTEDDLAPFPNVFYFPTIENADEKLKEIAYAGLKRLYGQSPSKLITDRLEKELEIIIDGGHSHLFMIAKLLADESNRKGYFVGSRGYTSASFVAFVSGFTNINPLAPHYICPECHYTEFHPEELCGWNMEDKTCPICGKALNKDGFFIPMEALFGANGDKVPDINLVFSDEILNDIVTILNQIFGEEKVVAGGTICFVGEKSAEYMLNQYLSESKNKLSAEQKNEVVNSFADIKRTTNRHPGVVFLLPEHLDVFDITPLQYSNNNSNNAIITHFVYYDLFLQNFDIFGHNDPTILKMLYDATNYNPKDILLDDTKTLKMFCGGDTDGIAEFSSDFSKELLKKLQPTTFEELIRISGISHGTNVWSNNGETLIEQGFNLKEIISCREDIINYLTQKGVCPKIAYKIMDFVRKGKQLTKEQKEIMQINNVPDWYIESCGKIKYMFPRAQSAENTLMAFKIAYYKAHFRTEFDEIIKNFM